MYTKDNIDGLIFDFGRGGQEYYITKKSGDRFRVWWDTDKEGVGYSAEEIIENLNSGNWKIKKSYYSIF